jgi:hypothetical protein
MVTETRETMFYPGSGPLNGGKTLRPASVYINGDVSSTELIYLEIVMCVQLLGLGERYCVDVPYGLNPMAYIHAKEGI